MENITPGKWVAVSDPADGRPLIVQHYNSAPSVNGEKDPRFIAAVGCDSPSSGWTEEDSANARLMAAAPDMLAALYYILEGLEESGFKSFRVAQGGDHAKAVRAAICKAEKG